MVEKKAISKSDIIGLYIEYILEHNQNPKTVYAFTKVHNFEESEFYNFFGSFEAIEKAVFFNFFINTLSLLRENEDYTNFDSRNKLLSFYFTFFENLTANRSYVLYALKKNKNNLNSLRTLSTLKHHFTEYIEQLNIEIVDMKEEKLNKIQRKALKESAYIQLLFTLKFWIEDTSSAFEKTDIFIEKSVNTTFDVLNIAPVKSILDLGKFLFKEKIKMN